MAVAKSRVLASQDIFDEVLTSCSLGNAAVTLGTMFRNPAMRLDGAVFAFLGHHGELIVKLPSDRIDRLEHDGVLGRVDMGNRTMREWASVSARSDIAATVELWNSLASEALAFITSASTG